MNSFFILLALFVLIEEGSAQFGPFTQLAPGQTIVSGELPTGGKLYYNFNGFPSGSCFGLREDATFDLVYGWFSDEAAPELLAYGDSQITGSASTSGNIKIGVTGWADTTFLSTHTRNGSFVMNLTVASATNDGDSTFATRVVLPSSQRSYLSNLYVPPTVFGSSCAGTADVDFVTFTLPVGACWSTQISRSFDEIFGLFAPNGTLIDVQDSSLRGIVDSTGQVNIAISGWNDNRFNGTHSYSGSYNLTIVTQTTGEQTDNTFATRQMLAAGVTVVTGDMWALTGNCQIGDVDFYDFQLTPGVCAQTSMVRNFDEIFGLYADNGTLLQTADSQISAKVPASGHWIIAVSGWNDNRFVGSHSYNGNYTLTINTFPTTQDGNNNFQTAVQVDGASTRSYVSTLESNTSPCSGAGDVDFVTFNNLPVGNCFYTLMNRNFDEILGWYDSNGVQISYSDTQIVGKVPSSGSITIAVSAWADSNFIGSHTSSGNYNLTIVTVPPPASDGDDTFETRTKLAAGVSTYSSNLAPLAAAPCNVVGDIDFLEFTATAGACFSTRVSSGFDDMVGWVADNGTILQVLDSSQLSGIVPQSGKLILAVTAYDDFALVGDHSRSGNYTLNVTITVSQTDQSESPLSPQFAVAGVAVSGDLYPSNPACGGGDKDFFFYVLPAGSCFYTVQNVTFDEYMGAFFSNGTLFATNDNSLSGFVPSDGVVIIGITGYPDTTFTGAHSRSGTYRLTTFSEVVTPDGDSTFQTSRVQPTPTPVSGSISAYTQCSGGGDMDFITFTNLVPDSCYQTQIVSNFTSGQYILGLFADNGTQLDYTYSQFTNTVPASGRLTFAISGSGDTTFKGDHNSVGTYTFSLNITTNAVVNDGNNNFASATVLGNATQYSSDLYAFTDTTPCSGDGGSSDVDFIQFIVKSKCDVTFTVDSSIDTYLGYYLENGTRVATTDSNDLKIQAPSSGIITFAITAWPDTSFTGAHSRSGNYNVTLGLDCGNAPDGFDRVTSGGAASGSLTAGQVDRWTFEQQIPGYCYVTNMDTSFDAVLGLYSDAGELIDWDDYSLMGIIPNSSQVNIAVSGWADTTFVGDHQRSGPYTLSLIVTHNEPPPPSDGNDSFQERIIVNDTQVSGSIWATIDQTPCPDDANTRNDVDYYQFIGLPNGYCAATRMEETFDSALALLDNNGNIVQWEDYNIYTLVGTSGVVNIAVTGYPDRELTGDHQKNGNYTLFLDLTRNDPAPPSDGNNNFVFSTVVAAGGRTVSGSIWSLSDKTPCPNDFTAMGDVDYYRFGPYTAGDCFQTQVTSNFDEYLGWFNNQGELIDDEDFQITGIVPADGFLYIAVTGYPDRTFIGNHNHNGNYTLTINLSRNTPPPQSDGNQSFNTSTVLTPGQVSVTGSIWATIDQTPCPNDHNTVNDVDFYTFRGLQAGSCFQTTENANFDQVTGWFNNSGRLVDWADYTLTGVIPADGTLHLAVSGWADTSFVGTHQHNGNYTLALTITRNDEPGERADNTFVGRVTYAAGINKVSGDIWYIRDRTPCPNDLPPSDVDFFTYTGLPAGLCFRTSTDTNFDTILGWYGNDGLQLVWSDGEIYGVVPDDGVVHLAVSGWADWYFEGDHTNGGRYTITIILDEDCDLGGGSGGGQGQWCANNCAGKTCGSNGCGGSRGTCGAGLFCLTDGSCSSSCNTTCFDGQECGYNGCGGYCGTCAGAQDVCSGGLCTCVGDCSGRECGDDGCGGSCGRCAGNQDQCFDGLCLCVANCTHHECGDDGCGGICGTCGPYYTCGNNHTCVRDPLTQPSCDDYFGFPHQEVSLVLLNEVNSLLREKILETIDNLESMRDALLEYDPESQLLNLASLIDQIHLFCSGPYHNDTCLSLSELEFIETAFLNAIHVVTVDPMSECAGRVCGFTSYGGSCGSCPTGQECTEDGQCICSYSCEGRTCGNAFQEEGTSMTLCPPRSCGTCADRFECTNYNCTPIPHPPITVGLFDCASQAPLGVDGNIDITGDNYMSTFQIPVGSNLTWVPEVQEGTFNFTFSALGYVGDSQEIEVEFTTTGIYFCMVRETVLIEIRDADLRTTINQPCSVNFTLQNIGDFTQTTPPNPFVHTIPDNGYGQYVFNVKCEGYDFRSEVNTIDPNTDIIYINVQRTPIKLMILDCESSISVNVQQTLQISSTFDLYVQVYDIPKNSYVEWVPPQIGTYDFMTSAIGYESSGESRTIDYTTTELQFCISRSTFLVGVQDINTKAYVTAACTITYNPPPPNGRATSITPPNPVSITVPDDGYGLWNWKTTCQGYLESNVDLAVNASTTLLILFVTPPPVTIDVRDIYTNTTIGTSALINYDGVASGSFNWNGPTLFQHYGFGTYTFIVHPDTLYQNSTTSVTISAATTTVILYVSPGPIQVDVRDRYTDTSITVGATINYSGAHSDSFRWNGVTSFQHQGYGTYTFVAQPDSIYGSGSATVTISVSTTSVIIYVSPPAVQIDVRDSLNDATIGVGATINYSGVASGSFRWNGITEFNHSAYGTYTFVAQPDSLYGSGSVTVSINTNTTLVIIYVSPPPLQIDVRDGLSDVSITIPSTINYSGVSSGSFRWTGITSFEPTGYGSYTFVAQPDSVYGSGSVTVTVNVNTALVIIYVSPPAVQIDVRDRTNDASIRVSTTINYSGVSSGTFRWNGITSFEPTGYGAYSFTALPDSSYTSGTTSITIDSTTTLIIIYVEPNTVQIDIRERTSNATINVGANVAYSGVVSGSFRWTGLYTFQHGGDGSYTFSATPDSTYTTGSTTVQISSSTTLIIIYVEISEFCGNGICAGTETATNCFADCVSLFFEFENADGSGPVNGPTVNLFHSNPRDANSNTGPNRNSVTAAATRTTGNASNTVLDETSSYGTMVYIESVVSGFINFYWVANTSNVDPLLGVYRLRVHLSRTLGANDFNYRFVNTWRPIDAEPEPYSPTDLNLHLFYSSGALDINNANLQEGGFSIGVAVADSKQSGGPATMDISPASNILIGIWNSKPPRNSAIAPSQNGRHIVDSGSYVVVYGKTSNAATGKQLGQLVLDQLLSQQPALKSDATSDLWFAGTFTADQPGQNQPTISAGNKLKAATITSAREMFFDCEVYAYCNNFRVPYSDTGRRSTENDEN